MITSKHGIGQRLKCQNPFCFNVIIEGQSSYYKSSHDGAFYCRKMCHDDHLTYLKSREGLFDQVKKTAPKKTESEKTASEIQVGGNHYKNIKIQPVQYALENNLNFCQGNVVKYITRYKDKNGLEDLKKAKHYIDLLIEHEYGGQK